MEARHKAICRHFAESIYDQQKNAHAFSPEFVKRQMWKRDFAAGMELISGRRVVGENL